MKPAKPFPWATIIKAVVSVVLLIILAVLVDPTKIMKAAAGFQVIWVGPILALIAASVLVSALKWGVLLRAQGLPWTFGQVFGTYSTALFFNNFLPSSIGGDGVRILIMGKSTGNTPGVSASVIVERTLATASLGLLGLITGSVSRFPSTLALSILAAVAVFGIALCLLLISGWLPRGVRNGTGKASGFLRDFADSARILRTKPLALLTSFLLSLVFQGLVAGVVGAVMAGLGTTMLPAPDTIYATSASSVLAMIPLGLNGYGLREGAFIHTLGPYGIAAAAALAISVLFALAVSVYSLTGALYWVAVRKKVKQA